MECGRVKACRGGFGASTDHHWPAVALLGVKVIQFPPSEKMESEDRKVCQVQRANAKQRLLHVMSDRDGVSLRHEHFTERE